MLQGIRELVQFINCSSLPSLFYFITSFFQFIFNLSSCIFYQVSVDEAGVVRVKAKRTDLEINKRMKKMSARDPQNKKTVVIVGGGPAGAVCAETLRQEGFTGRIVMVCKEDVVPYDRIKVSKIFDFDIQKAALRSPLFYNDHKIETKLGVEAIGIGK